MGRLPPDGARERPLLVGGRFVHQALASPVDPAHLVVCRVAPRRCAHSRASCGCVSRDPVFAAPRETEQRRVQRRSPQRRHLTSLRATPAGWSFGPWRPGAERSSCRSLARRSATCGNSPPRMGSRCGRDVPCPVRGPAARSRATARVITTSWLSSEIRPRRARPAPPPPAPRMSASDASGLPCGRSRCSPAARSRADATRSPRG